MRLIASLLSLSFAFQLLMLPGAAQAEDAAQADPFRPVQPSWDATETADAPAAATPKKAETAPAAEDNEQFLFDAKDEPPPEEKTEAAPVPEPTAAPIEERVAPAATQPGREVDLHAPHVWMVSGAIVLGVSFLAALTIATQLDEPGLAGATLGIGGLLGLTGLSVGVITQNQRLEAAGQRVPPALPSGLSLSLSFTR